jgi:hypothetical protein
MVSVFLLINIAFMPSMVSAEFFAGSEIVNEGDFWHFEIPIVATSEIDYTVSVMIGDPVDIFLFDEENFERYQTDQVPAVIGFVHFEFINEGSRLNASFADITVTLDEGTYFLVVDNTIKGEASPPEDNVNNTATITYSLNYPTLGEMLCSIFVIIGCIVAAILILYLVLKRGKQPRSYQPLYTQPNIYQPSAAQIPPMIPCKRCGKNIPIDSVWCPYCEVKQSNKM